MATKEKVWTDEEKAAMQASARERKVSAKRSPAEERAEGLKDLEGALAKMPADDRAMGERIHVIVTAAAPSLVPKTYYGMPAYAREGKDGKTIAFYKPKSKFKMALDLRLPARRDPGRWRHVADQFAVITLTPAVEARIAELVRKASS